MFSFAHIVNPVLVDESSDLYAAQPVTFESMRLAQEYAKGSVNVELFSAQFPEDVTLVPAWLTCTRDLDRSVLEAGNIHGQRKLPLLQDILNRLYETSKADYFIYSNVDIAPMPYFYLSVAQLVKSGYDSIVINRRTIPKSLSDPSQVALMWAEVGEKHPGHDCFVFSRDLMPRFNLGQVCLGASWVGRVLLWNLCVHTKNFQELTDLHLTFHLGNDKVWKDQRHVDYENHNRIQAANVLDFLVGTYGPFSETSSIWPYLPPDLHASHETIEGSVPHPKKRASLLTFFSSRNKNT